MKHNSRNSKAYQALAKWLRKRREEQALSVRALAEKLDVPHSLVVKIENCSRKIDALELIEYCQALNVDPKDCIAEVESVLKKSPHY